MPSDPIRNDPNIMFANAREFARLLQRAAEGHALWHPTTSGRIGDCGIITGGAFEKVLNVYDHSPGLRCPLTRPTTAQLQDPCDDLNTAALCSAQLHSVSFDGHGEFQADRLPIAMTFALKWSHGESSLAYLRFLGEYRRTERLGYHKRMELEDYIDNYRSEIRSGHTRCTDLVIVYGVTRAAGWVSAVAHRSDAKLDVSAGVSGPSIGAGLAVHTENQENFGPSEIDAPEASAESAPPDRNVLGLPKLHTAEICSRAAPPVSNGAEPDYYCDHCIVLRVVQVKWRRFPKLLKRSFEVAATESQGRPPSTSNPPGRLVQVQCTAGAAGTGIQSASGGGLTESDDAAGERSEEHRPEPDGPGETTGTDEDLLSLILARILGADEEIESVLGSWQDIENFLADYGELDRDTEFVAQLVVNEGDNAGRILKLMAMVSGGHHASPTDETDSLYIKERLVLQRPWPADGKLNIYEGYFVERPDARVAVKRLRYANEDDDRNARIDMALERQVLALASIMHPHILGFDGLVRFNGHPCIVRPWLDRGNVMMHIKAHAGDREKIIREVAEGLEYLHSGMALPDGTVVVHGSIHPNNVLISIDGSAILCDFGLGNLLPDPPRLLENRYDGIAYFAPELQMAVDTVRRQPSVQSDVFSFGMLVYEVLGGRPPMVGQIAYDRAARQRSGAIPAMLQAGDRPPRIERMCDELWQVVCDCWKTHPEDRPTMKQVYNRLVALEVAHRK